MSLVTASSDPNNEEVSPAGDLSIDGYEAQFIDQDLVIDGDLVTARTGKHCYLLARQIIEMLETRPRSTGAFDNSPAFAELATAH